ncbi:alpha-hydroxy acid oxidase [Sagittula salina]|uniref:Alpha-hydroxy-acid oxidizing protein n=1 Tax=Sagittula salina TaxID=2820268 RepID=A0A940MTR7_9RHOB|nr:alpha-hydroxy acid oxidase [Sagittula salina]MBP0482804.1 alpha-hydroxy-acid oxidizing protein [Sagittula salina]
MPDTLPPTLPDYMSRAATGLAPDLAAYFLSGAGGGAAEEANGGDLARVTLRPRALRDMRGGHTRLDLLGRTLNHPVIVAPFAYQTLLTPEGEVATARGAEAQGALMVLSAQSTRAMADVRAAGATCMWFQLYWQSTLANTLALAERAANAGFSALILTVDAPVQGVRDAEIRSGFRLSQCHRAINLDGIPQPAFAPLREGESLLFDRVAHVLPDWKDIAAFCRDAPLPVILKGIMTGEDARDAVACGAAGLVVSNHGGRVLEALPSTISVLPEVVRAVDGAVPVLMDGGIRRGWDVFRALALGARAVLVGRPAACGLSVAGALGVSHVLRLLRDELESTMLLTGCRTLAEITRDRVRAPF